MSTILSVNDLSLVMNEYFTAIINVVTSFGGDVMKFAGTISDQRSKPTTMHQPRSKDDYYRRSTSTRRLSNLTPPKNSSPQATQYS